MQHQNCVIIKQCNSACHEPGMHKFDFSVELLTIFGLVATLMSAGSGVGCGNLIGRHKFSAVCLKLIGLFDSK